MVMGYIICAIYHNNMSALEYLNYYLKRHNVCVCEAHFALKKQMVDNVTELLQLNLLLFSNK